MRLLLAYPVLQQDAYPTQMLRRHHGFYIRWLIIRRCARILSAVQARVQVRHEVGATAQGGRNLHR